VTDGARALEDFLTFRGSLRERGRIDESTGDDERRNGNTPG